MDTQQILRDYSRFIKNNDNTRPLKDTCGNPFFIVPVNGTNLALHCYFCNTNVFPGTLLLEKILKVME